MTEEKLNKKIKFYNRLMGLFAGVSVIIFLSSPFIFIWIGWALAWKLFLSGFFGILIYKFIDKVFKDVVNDIKSKL